MTVVFATAPYKQFCSTGWIDVSRYSQRSEASEDRQIAGKPQMISRPKRAERRLLIELWRFFFRLRQSDLSAACRSLPNRSA